MSLTPCLTQSWAGAIELEAFVTGADFAAFIPESDLPSNYDIRIEIIRPDRICSQSTNLKDLNSYFTGKILTIDDAYYYSRMLTKRLSKYDGFLYSWDDSTFYLLKNRTVKVKWPWIANKNANVKKLDEIYYKKYFTGPDGYRLRWNFVNDLNASIVCCKIGRQEGWDYSKYKDRAQILLSYMKDVYNYNVKLEPVKLRGVGQLIKLFEKDLSQL